MGDEDRRTLETVLERGFDRMESRFDGLAAEIRAHGTAIAVIQAGCSSHKAEDEKRDKRISSIQRAVGDVDREVSQVTAKPAPAQTLSELVAVLDEREEARAKRDREAEEARAKRVRGWLTLAIPVAVALLGVPTVRGCLGEERAARVEQAVQRLEAKPAQKVVVLPSPPIMIPSKPDAER
jgi:hypothetical protein